MNRFFAKSLAVSLGLIVLLGVPTMLIIGSRDAHADQPGVTAPEEKGAQGGEAQVAGKITNPASQQALLLAIAVMVSASCLGAAYAVGRIGAAVMGAASEKPELIGRSIIFMGLAEGIAIYGLLMGILLLLLKL
jgi:V/A-type H+-transporting ATPase subunit K